MAYYSFEYPERDGGITSQMGNILDELGKVSGEHDMKITSYMRTPEQQAAIMINDYTTQRMCDLYNNKKYCEIRKKYNQLKIDATKNLSAVVDRHDVWYKD